MRVQDKRALKKCIEILKLYKKYADLYKYMKKQVSILWIMNILIAKRNRCKRMNFEYCEGRVHVIEEGDTLYQLSRRYNVPLALILRANPFSDVYNLQIGDEICIPTMIGRPPEMPEQPNVPNRPNMPGNNQQGRPDRPITMPQFPNLFMYTVKEEDSMEDILDEFEISLEDLLNFNDLDEIMLLPGSVVKVPVRRRNED